MENTSPEAPKRKSSTASIVVIVVVLLLFIVFVPGWYDVHREEQRIQLIAKNMLSLPDSARTAINGHVARTSSLVGSGKGVAVAPNKMKTSHQELEWSISDDGSIRGRNTASEFLAVAVEWTSAVQDKRVVWSCKVTFPGRFSKLTPPPCPETP